MAKNDLEIALTDESNGQLDFYLENSSTKQIRDDIEGIRKRAALSTNTGAMRERIQAALDHES